MEEKRQEDKTEELIRSDMMRKRKEEQGDGTKKRGRARIKGRKGKRRFKKERRRDKLRTGKVDRTEERK